MKRIIAAVALSALAAACSPQKPKAGGPGAPQFNTDLAMTEIMGHIVDPGSFMIWKNSGTMVDAQGEHDLSPTTQEGWETVVSGATIVMEAGNILQMDGRRRAPEDHWNKYAQQLTAQAKLVREAADKKDKDGVYKLGADLYLVCVACHEEYVIQPDIKANGPAKGNPLPELPAGAVKK